jgi:hypothetical protein
VAVDAIGKKSGKATFVGGIVFSNVTDVSVFAKVPKGLIEDTSVTELLLLIGRRL